MVRYYSSWFERGSRGGEHAFIQLEKCGLRFTIRILLRNIFPGAEFYKYSASRCAVLIVPRHDCGCGPCCRCGMRLSEHASLNGILKEAELVDIMGQVCGPPPSLWAQQQCSTMFRCMPSIACMQ